MIGRAEPFEVLVLGGGPDAEREVSVGGAASVVRALRADARCQVRSETIGRLDAAGLARLGTGSPDEVIFPVLHGPWGEGGVLQRVLEEDGRPFVGCDSRAAMGAMDKVRTKQAALGCGVGVLETALLDPLVLERPPFAMPVIVKPVCQGSSIGLRVCRDQPAWEEARATAAEAGYPFMVEPMLEGAREFAMAAVHLGAEAGVRTLPPIEIRPEGAVYDYEAKYVRTDTVYETSPVMSDALRSTLEGWTRAIVRALGVRHLCRADYLVDDEDRAVLLEVNTMPGFTERSLLPQAAEASGITMPALCVGLVERAWLDARGAGVTHEREEEDQEAGGRRVQP